MNIAQRGCSDKARVRARVRSTLLRAYLVAVMLDRQITWK